MKKRVLITGSNGLLGQKLSELYRQHEDRVEFLATGTGVNRFPGGDILYREMDITNPVQVREVMEAFKPNCVINTAAMTNVDQCEAEKERCRVLNTEAVDTMATICNELEAHFIHVSTDFIFDGTAGPYTEEATPAPLSFYGWSKWDAEQAIMKKSKRWSILRTVLVYGVVNDMSRSNIVLWAKSALSSGKSIQVVDDQFRTPTLAEDLAMGCYLTEVLGAEGVFNISGPDFMSVFELVNRVADYWKLPKELITRTNSSGFTQPAKRPLVTGFDINKARRILGYTPHTFEEGLALMEGQLGTSA